MVRCFAVLMWRLKGWLSTLRQMNVYGEYNYCTFYFWRFNMTLVTCIGSLRLFSAFLHLIRRWKFIVFTENSTKSIQCVTGSVTTHKINVWYWQRTSWSPVIMDSVRRCLALCWRFLLVACYYILHGLYSMRMVPYQHTLFFIVAYNHNEPIRTVRLSQDLNVVVNV